MYYFAKDSQNGMKFVGYKAHAVANRSISTDAQNIVLGNPVPDMLKVPSGNTEIMFLYYIFLNLAYQCSFFIILHGFL